MTAPIASGWSESPGGPCTHWKAPPFHGARRNRPFAGPTKEPFAPSRAEKARRQAGRPFLTAVLVNRAQKLDRAQGRGGGRHGGPSRCSTGQARAARAGRSVLSGRARRSASVTLRASLSQPIAEATASCKSAPFSLASINAAPSLAKRRTSDLRSRRGGVRRAVTFDFLTYTPGARPVVVRPPPLKTSRYYHIALKKIDRVGM
jgi:hypothetical protein